MSVDSSKALTSSGAYAPANLSSFTSDPMAGMRHQSSAVEPYVFLRIPTPSQLPSEPVDQLSQLLRAVGDENRHDQIEFGPPVGNEEW